VIGGVNYTNSTNGNIISDGTSTFGYDAENRLISFDTTGTTNDATYAYDALGRRVKKTVNGTSTFFVYDGDDIIADYSSAGTLLREYIHGDKVDEILAMQAGANTYYYHYDGLGSVTEITDDTGAIVENYTYDPYGTPSLTISTINNRYRFTGREYDEESGLYHYRARAYSPAIGRFMQRDPIGILGGINLYAYVGNRPINYTDAYGLLNPKGGCAFGVCTYTQKDYENGKKDLKEGMKQKYPWMTDDDLSKMADKIMKEMKIGEAQQLKDLQKKNKQEDAEKLLQDICERTGADCTPKKLEEPCEPKQK
jgi:RHS repeat-associated protein